MIYRFGDHRLDRDRAELLGPDGAVALEPKAFALLCLLVENHDRVVSKDEMIDILGPLPDAPSIRPKWVSAQLDVTLGNLA